MNLKLRKRYSSIPPIIGLFLLACGIGLMFFSEQYKVVWRSSLFLNAPNSLLLNVLPIICVFTVGLLVLLRRYLHYSPFIIRTALLFSIWFGFPLFLNFIGLGLLLNGALDNSSVKTHQSTIIYKEVINARTTSWKFHIEDWEKSNGVVYLFVNPDFYEAHSVGTEIEVKTKDGFFGYEWLVSYK